MLPFWPAAFLAWIRPKEMQAIHCVTVGNESNATGVKCTAIDLICNLFNWKWKMEKGKRGGKIEGKAANWQINNVCGRGAVCGTSSAGFVCHCECVCVCVCRDSCKEVSRSLMQMPGKCKGAHANYEKLCTTWGKSMESLFGFLATAADQETDRQTDTRLEGGGQTKGHFTPLMKQIWSGHWNRTEHLTWLLRKHKTSLSPYLALSFYLPLSLSLLSFRKCCVFHTQTHTAFGCIMKPYPFSPAKPNGNAIFFCILHFSLFEFLLMIK